MHLRLSQTAEYALRAAVWLSARACEPQTTAAIARGTGVPAGYLAKILAALARAQLVTSQRGRGGGFLLARPSSRITLLEVVVAADPGGHLAQCPLNLKEHRDRLCALHTLLATTFAAADRSLSTLRLSELLDGPPARRPFGGGKLAAG